MSGGVKLKDDPTLEQQKEFKKFIQELNDASVHFETQLKKMNSI
jgi:hypothetical protein